MNASTISTKRKFVGTTQYGRKTVLSEKHSLRFDIRDFEHQSPTTAKSIVTSCLSCHGEQWYLEVIKDVKVLVYLTIRNCEALRKVGNDGVVAKFCMRTRLEEMPETKFVFRSDSQQYCWNLMPLKDVIDPTTGYLEDGTLSIEVDMQVYMEKKAVWKPPPQSSNNTLSRLLESQELTDITFVVEDQKFPVHRCILAMNAPYLYSLSEGTTQEEEDDIIISGVDPAVFKALLRFIYASEIPDVSLLSSEGRGLLETADRFECKSFKLHVESCIVEQRSMVNENNAAEWLFFADSHSCALLKEAAINVITMHLDTVMTTPGWAQLKESSGKLLAEVIETQQRCKSLQENDTIENLDVGSLRERLTEKGLDVDGTREMLIDRLKNKKR